MSNQLVKMYHPAGPQPLSQRSLISFAILVYCVSAIQQVAAIGEFSTNELRNDEPERWIMTSYQSPLVPISGDTSPGGGPQATPNRNNGDTMVHEREFISPQLRVQIECQKDKTVVKLNFTQPFAGTIGAGKLETTKCKLVGDRGKFYQLEVRHNETQCDTQWDGSSNSIFNTLFVRFHSSLETGSDLAKNIMCRLSVGDLIVGRRPAKKSQRPKQKAQKPPATTNKESVAK